MKVISGKYKGRNIYGFDIHGTRPTMDRVKESIFGMIQDKIPNSTILDLFSGSGNLGIEALSEGASFAYLCDHNRKAKEIMKKNIKEIGIDQVEILEMDYKKCLKEFYEKNISFDIIFLDPPYQTNYIEESIRIIEEYQLLKKGGILVCESDSFDKIIYQDSFICKKDRKYGDKVVVILEKV